MTKRNMIISCMIIAMCWISACSEDNLVETPSDDEQQIEKKDGTVSGDSPRLKVPDHLLARDKEISVSLKWIESVKMTSGFVDSIDISLTNNTAADLNVLLKMYFSGLIEMSATKEMGQVTIPAYKTEIVRLAAVDIPIQSSDGS